MTAGSASVPRDSPPAFGKVLAWKDEVVPWMPRLAPLRPRRREMLGIIDWRMEQCAARDVEFRFDTLAESQPRLQRCPEGSFTLWRNGDAVAARNTHAAIHDALRPMKDA